METLETIISAHPFFEGLEDNYMKLVVGCASNVRFQSDTYIFKEGNAANNFYLLREGKVALEIFAPQLRPIIVETLQEGEILGWSWLLPPFTWKFNAHATTAVRAISIDGKCLRKKCEENHDLGYEILNRFSKIIALRLEAALLQITDVYAVHR